MRKSRRGRRSYLQLLPALESGGVERGTLEMAQARAEADRCAQIIMQHWFDAHQVEAIPGR